MHFDVESYGHFEPQGRLKTTVPCSLFRLALTGAPCERAVAGPGPGVWTAAGVPFPKGRQGRIGLNFRCGCGRPLSELSGGSMPRTFCSGFEKTHSSFRFMALNPSPSQRGDPRVTGSATQGLRSDERSQPGDWVGGQVPPVCFIFVTLSHDEGASESVTVGPVSAAKRWRGALE